MKSGHTLSAVLILLFASACAVALIQDRSLPDPSPSLNLPSAIAVQAPLPTISIPGVPASGQCCLWQVEKRADGKREARFDTPYRCDTGSTARGEMTVKAVLKTA